MILDWSVMVPMLLVFVYYSNKCVGTLIGMVEKEARAFFPMGSQPIVNIEWYGY